MLEGAFTSLKETTSKFLPTATASPQGRTASARSRVSTSAGLSPPQEYRPASRHKGKREQYFFISLVFLKSDLVGYKMQQFPRRPGGDGIEAVIRQTDRADWAGQKIMVPDISLPVIDKDMTALVGGHFAVCYPASGVQDIDMIIISCHPIEIAFRRPPMRFLFTIELSL